MKETKYNKDGKTRRVEPNYFTGKTRLADLSTRLGSKDSKMYHVEFFKGARTKLHLHNGGQILIVTGGTGSLVFFEKTNNGMHKFRIKQTKKIKLTEKSIAYIPPNILHTHGSTSKTRTFSHIAINLYPPKKIEPAAKWYESDFKSKVTKKL